MKFKINKDKLEQVVFKYLDNKKFFVKETNSDYYFLENENDKYKKIRIIKSGMVCFIYFELVEEIESFFSLEPQMVISVLTKYVEKTLNIKVSASQESIYRTPFVVENTLN